MVLRLADFHQVHKVHLGDHFQNYQTYSVWEKEEHRRNHIRGRQEQRKDELKNGNNACLTQLTLQLRKYLCHSVIDN